MRRPIWPRVAIVHLALFGCASQTGHSITVAPAPSMIDPGPDLTSVDTTVNPCVDFVAFACGNENHPVGRLQNLAALLVTNSFSFRRMFLDHLVKGAQKDDNHSTDLLREFYLRCSDTNARNAGLKDLREQLDQIARIETLPELAYAVGVRRASGLNVFIKLDTFWYAGAADEPVVARFALTDPDLHRQLHGRMHRLLPDYRRHLQHLAALTGAVSASDVDAALRVDSWLAAGSEPRRSDSTAQPQPLVSFSTLQRARFPWAAYLDGLRLPQSAPIRPANSDALARIEGLAQLPLADLRSSLKLAMIEGSASLLGLPFVEEETRFHKEIMKGQEHEAFELARACTGLASRTLGPWLNEAFLASLPPPSEEAARYLFDMIRADFARVVDSATWLDDATRRAAAAKVRNIAVRFVGDREPGLDSVVLPPGSLLNALMRMGASASTFNLAGVGAPPSRRLSPTNNSAMYSSFVNTVWISPLFVRPPYIHNRPFDALTFGALGTLMGHEVAHALSPTGRRFDGAGIRRETWPKEAIAGFEARMACLERQLGALDAGAVWKVDGHKTLDDDIADLVGVQLSLGAMETDGSDVASTKARSDRRRDFFLAYVQEECGWSSDLDAGEAVDEDHSPLRRRISGVLANVPEFAETFHCPPGTPMAPRQRCAIW